MDIIVLLPIWVTWPSRGSIKEVAFKKKYGSLSFVYIFNPVLLNV